MTEAYREFIARHKCPYDSDVAKAFALAEEAHTGQLRHSGEPYFTHPLAVADIIADLGLDNTTIMAGVLHDVVEDTDVTLDDIRKGFSDELAQLVDGVTKLKQYSFSSREEQQSESLRKMFLAMAQDIRVVIIKLADRLHNMRTLKYQSENKQIEKARETLEIYAPLAHRLGIGIIKCELEDLSLKFLEPDEFYEIANKISDTRKDRESLLLGIIDRIEDQLAEMHIRADIEGRPKHIYSIYKKMKEKDKTFSEVYDLIAIRVIVSSIEDCYGVLGLVHTMWKPLTLHFKDYVAVPKSNMYQSIHTTLLGSDGIPFEVQIRTYDMHRTAEYGIAAHWKFKENSQSPADLDEKLAWLRELMEWQNDVRDSREFMDSLKIDMFAEQVLVFTPNGEVKEFIDGATALDFAYSIRSDVGNRCYGARVNGKIVPLSYKLNTGDIVEILTSPATPGPSREWLEIVKTPAAKTKLKQWFKSGMRDENVSVGKERFDREAKRQGYRAEDLLRPEWVAEILQELKLDSEDDMFESIGYGAITVNRVLDALIDRFRRADSVEDDHMRLHVIRKDIPPDGNGPSLRGNGNMNVRFGKCCNPLPGDEIVGYITSGRGLCVHKKHCENLSARSTDKDRLVEVEWAGDAKMFYDVWIRITADDRAGLLVDVTNALLTNGREICSISARRDERGGATIEFESDVRSVKDLDTMLRALRALEGVRTVERLEGQEECAL